MYARIFFYLGKTGFTRKRYDTLTVTYKHQEKKRANAEKQYIINKTTVSSNIVLDECEKNVYSNSRVGLRKKLMGDSSMPLLYTRGNYFEYCSRIRREN